MASERVERALRVVHGAPVAEPVSLAEAKEHLRVTSSREDALIWRQVQAAREWLERFTGRAFVNRTIEVYLDAAPALDLELPVAPVSAISKIETFDAAGVPVLLEGTEYALDPAGRQLPIVRWADGVAWPEDVRRFNAIRITATAGYGADGASVPAAVRAAVLLLVGAMYENREEGVDRAPHVARVSASALVWDLRLFLGAL